MVKNRGEIFAVIPLKGGELRIIAASCSKKLEKDIRTDVSRERLRQYRTARQRTIVAACMAEENMIGEEG
jgi:hypothetical protein